MQSTLRLVSFSRLLLVGAIVLAASLPYRSAAQLPAMKFDNNAGRQLQGFKLVKNLIILPVMINGNGPYNFVLDTGVGLFIITDSTLITNFTNLRSIKITGLGEGRDVDAWITNSVSVEIGSHITGKLSAAVLKKDAFNLSNFTGMPIHGLLGYEFFSSFIVKIDYQQKVLTAYRPDKGNTLRKGYKIPLSIEERKPYVVAAVVRGGEKIPVKLIIDSGAGHPVSLESEGDTTFSIPKKNIPANLGVGLSGPISGSIARIDEFHLGKYVLKNVTAAFPNASNARDKIVGVERNGNMGNSVLKRFVILFDYGREYLYVRPSFGFGEPFEHDMSGLELSAFGPDYSHVLITRVEPGSAGDIAGLQADDEILSINFKPVKSMSLEEITELFHSREDRSFILDIVPKETKDTERVIITLKRRI